MSMDRSDMEDSFEVIRSSWAGDGRADGLRPLVCGARCARGRPRGPRWSARAAWPARWPPACRAPARSRGRPRPAPSSRSARPSAPWCRRRRCGARSPAVRPTMRGARPSEGSSSISRRGALIMARATATICCSPPLMVPASCCARSRSFGKSSKACSRRRARCGLGHEPAAELQVLRHRHLGKQLPPLGHQRHAGPHDLVWSSPAGPRRPAAPRRCAGSGHSGRAAASSCRRRWGRGSP